MKKLLAILNPRIPEFRRKSKQAKRLIAEVKQLLTTLEDLETKGELSGLRAQLEIVKEKRMLLESLVSDLEKISERWQLMAAAFTFLLFTVATLLFSTVRTPIKHSWNMNFYVVIAQVIPVFLIASSVNHYQEKLSRNGYFAVLLGEYIPSIVAEIACLVTIAAGKEYRWVAYTILAAGIQLLLSFCFAGLLASRK